MHLEVLITECADELKKGLNGFLDQAHISFKVLIRGKKYCPVSLGVIPHESKTIVENVTEYAIL